MISVLSRISYIPSHKFPLVIFMSSKEILFATSFDEDSLQMHILTNIRPAFCPSTCMQNVTCYHEDRLRPHHFNLVLWIHTALYFKTALWDISLSEDYRTISHTHINLELEISASYFSFPEICFQRGSTQTQEMKS